ncbi:mcm2 3 5 family protein [Stylonychia lemnae]|uniref:Mcm2 3 5 family protein n=1 Tax=Stylonychia lemnae TaxID=5949 RepID=A0A078AHT4_STYLE|nr:mcm2 3 5 family protein [Stylonychia lemnae]|eukprot:CDW81446.1 mcm2 3 5 family protein [Stylonychia lemnae]
MSIPRQTKIYVEKLRNEADMKGSKIFEFNEMIRIGKEINLQVGDFKVFLEKLNSQNILIMKPNKMWELS